MQYALHLAEKRVIPDTLIRYGIRRLLKKRISDETAGTPEKQQERLMALIGKLQAAPLAVHTADANIQHYEVPPGFFEQALGPHLKYSCCYFTPDCRSLAEAEAAMLTLTCSRAEIQDGMDILELGCGWGSLTLWLAKHYPGTRITAVSNSSLQRAFIEKKAEEAGYHNIQVITCDMNSFDTDTCFDRVLSIEMFEHMRNYNELLARIAGWMKPDAKLFVHIFTHRLFAYLYETEGPDDWMGHYFFTGGIMPSDSLLLYFQDDVILENHWIVNGTHYCRTAECWLSNMDRRSAQIIPVFIHAYGSKDAALWFQRWRIFFMACAELWGYRNGTEWFVSHYLFRKHSR
jgi:cyclopropane-fatty-acyl-phospholipid synthase